MIVVRLLRFAFRLLYHQFAWTYDFVAWIVSAGQWKKWVLSMEPHLDGAERILEIGHGPGNLQERLLRDGRRVVGVDLSPQMGRMAGRRLTRLGLAPRLVRADAQQLPFPGSAFDAVVATFPAEYIAEPAAWGSFYRVLADCGRILVLLGATPLGGGLLRRVSRLLFRITNQQIKEPGDVIRARFTSAMAESGLEIEFRRAEVNRSTVFFILGKKG